MNIDHFPAHREIAPSTSVGVYETRRLDTPLLAGLILLSGIGFMILFSAGEQNMPLLIKQGTRLGIAFTIMIILAQVPPHQLHRYAPLLYFIGIIALIGVLFVGKLGNGAQRWLDLGFFRFQPSEMIKITTPLMISWYLAEHPLPPRFRTLMLSGVLVLAPTLLIAKQPDLGTALLVAVSGCAALFFAGISGRLIASFLIGVAAFIPMMWYLMLDYQKARVLTLLEPEADPLGTGYHILQSKIAIGSGGIHGKGWLNGTQSHLEFLPESSTDFVFAVFAEEFGLSGCLALLTAYLLIICRGLYIAVQAQDTFSRILAGSLTVTFFVYVFVNIGMVVGILPVVGIPLPLISYGGTSMVTLLAGFGLLMSIHTHKNFLPL